jgi:hypothetical protein
VLGGNLLGSVLAIHAVNSERVDFSAVFFDWYDDGQFSRTAALHKKQSDRSKHRNVMTLTIFIQRF